MKPLQVVCISLMLAGTLLLAQSDRVSLTNQANGLSAAEPARSRLRANSSEIPQGSLFPQTAGARVQVQANPGPHSQHLRIKQQVQAAPEQVLYTFQGSPDDGEGPGDLIFDSKGNLYGTTAYGGPEECGINDEPPGCGTVFEFSPNGSGGWTETILYSFQSLTDGSLPGDLMFDQSGNLYGTTWQGGSDGFGTVFELSPNGSGGWNKATLYSFQGPPDGYEPDGLIVDQKGDLFGTTIFGGSSALGNVFELSPNGSGGWTETTLYNFQGGASDGAEPGGSLIFDQAGNLYGVTAQGGPGSLEPLTTGSCNLGTVGCGTVYRLSPNGSGGWMETIVYIFQGGDSDGAQPSGPLILDQAGNLYGTTFYGGGTGCGGLGCGTVFELIPDGSGGWKETILHSFQGSDGHSPGELIFDQAGGLYGTSGGGAFNFGTVFELSPSGSGSWNLTVLYSFPGGTDGVGPGALILDQSGHLYGGAGGGLTGYGVLYELFKEPSAGFSPTSLSLGNQNVGVTSGPQVLTLTNTGGLALAITTIQITGANSSDFGQTNNCPSSLPPNGSCNISVTFAPTAAGNRSAALSATDNASGSPQVAGLTGIGKLGDFSLTVTSQTSLTVTPGQAANYAIAVAPISGFAQKVSLSCSGALPRSTCTVTPSSVTLNGTNSVPSNVAVVTSGPAAALMRPAGAGRAGERVALWLALSVWPGLVLCGSRGRKRLERAIYGLLLLCALSVVMVWSACGGGSSSSGGGGTPPGTYTLKVTGTYSSGSTSIVHSANLTLVVE
jgi:uncharacterized repeat protein (TIGR03803 family)